MRPLSTVVAMVCVVACRGDAVKTQPVDRSAQPSAATSVQPEVPASADAGSLSEAAKPLKSTAAPPPSAVPARVSSPEPPEDDCPAKLPVARPAELVFGVHRVILPHNGNIEHFGGELHDGTGTCESTPCTVVPVNEIDALWAAFRKHRFNAMTEEPVHRSPHYGSRTVWVRWPGTRCERSDGSRSQVSKSHHKAFYELFDLLNATGLAHQP